MTGKTIIKRQTSRHLNMKERNLTSKDSDCWLHYACSSPWFMLLCVALRSNKSDSLHCKRAHQIHNNNDANTCKKHMWRIAARLISTQFLGNLPSFAIKMPNFREIENVAMKNGTVLIFFIFFSFLIQTSCWDLFMYIIFSLWKIHIQKIRFS